MAVKEDMEGPAVTAAVVEAARAERTVVKVVHRRMAVMAVTVEMVAEAVAVVMAGLVVMAVRSSLKFLKISRNSCFWFEPRRRRVPRVGAAGPVREVHQEVVVGADPRAANFAIPSVCPTPAVARMDLRVGGELTAFPAGMVAQAPRVGRHFKFWV